MPVALEQLAYPSFVQEMVERLGHKEAVTVKYVSRQICAPVSWTGRACFGACVELKLGSLADGVIPGDRPNALLERFWRLEEVQNTRQIIGQARM